MGDSDLHNGADIIDALAPADVENLLVALRPGHLALDCGHLDDSAVDPLFGLVGKVVVLDTLFVLHPTKFQTDRGIELPSVAALRLRLGAVTHSADLSADLGDADNRSARTSNDPLQVGELLRPNRLKLSDLALLGHIKGVPLCKTPGDSCAYGVEHDQINARRRISGSVLDAILESFRLQKLELVRVRDRNPKSCGVVGDNIVLPVHIQTGSARRDNGSASLKRQRRLTRRFVTPNLGHATTGKARTRGDTELVRSSSDKVVDGIAPRGDMREAFLERVRIEGNTDVRELLPLLLDEVFSSLS